MCGLLILDLVTTMPYERNGCLRTKLDESCNIIRNFRKGTLISQLYVDVINVGFAYYKLTNDIVTLLTNGFGMSIVGDLNF